MMVDGTEEADNRGAGQAAISCQPSAISWEPASTLPASWELRA